MQSVMGKHGLEEGMGLKTYLLAYLHFNVVQVMTQLEYGICFNFLYCKLNYNRIIIIFNLID